MVQKFDEAVVLFAISAVVVSVIAGNPWPLAVLFLFIYAAAHFARKP